MRNMKKQGSTILLKSLNSEVVKFKHWNGRNGKEFKFTLENN